jgi:hypothetical protein
MWLVAGWYAIVAGKLIVIGFGAIALALAAVCATAYRRGISP